MLQRAHKPQPPPRYRLTSGRSETATEAQPEHIIWVPGWKEARDSQLAAVDMQIHYPDPIVRNRPATTVANRDLRCRNVRFSTHTPNPDFLPAPQGSGFCLSRSWPHHPKCKSLENLRAPAHESGPPASSRSWPTLTAAAMRSRTSAGTIRQGDKIISGPGGLEASLHRALVLFPAMLIGRRPTPPGTTHSSRNLCALVATSHHETFLIKHERMSFRSGRATRCCALPTAVHVIVSTVQCRAAWVDGDDGDDAEVSPREAAATRKKASNRLPRG